MYVLGYWSEGLYVTRDISSTCAVICVPLLILEPGRCDKEGSVELPVMRVDEFH